MIVAKQTERPHLHLAAYAAVALLVLGAVAAVAWPSGDPEALWKAAEKAFEERRFSDSSALMARVGKLRAPTPLDWTLRAQLAMAADKPDEALDDLAHVPDSHRMAPQAHLQSGQLELRRDRLPPAEAHFKKALELNPGLTRARRELVYIYGTQLRREDLDATFRALAEKEPLTFSEVFLWCLSRGVTWEATEIVQTLAKCVKADPSNRWARLGLAEGLRQLNRFDEAEQALAPLPDPDPDARAARVRLALARGDDVEAEALLDNGPADHLELALLRGQLALARNDAPGALRQYRLAHQLDPHRRESVFGLGQALQLAGDAAAAAPYLLEARKLDRLASLVGKAGSDSNRADTALVRDLGAACAEVGQVDQARAWYEIAVERNPLDTQAQQALDRLKVAR